MIELKFTGTAMEVMNDLKVLVYKGDADTPKATVEEAKVEAPKPADEKATKVSRRRKKTVEEKTPTEDAPSLFQQEEKPSVPKQEEEKPVDEPKPEEVKPVEPKNEEPKPVEPKKEEPKQEAAPQVISEEEKTKLRTLCAEFCHKDPGGKEKIKQFLRDNHLSRVTDMPVSKLEEFKAMVQI